MINAPPPPCREAPADRPIPLREEIDFSCSSAAGPDAPGAAEHTISSASARTASLMCPIVSKGGPSRLSMSCVPLAQLGGYLWQLAHAAGNLSGGQGAPRGCEGSQGLVRVPLFNEASTEGTGGGGGCVASVVLQYEHCLQTTTVGAQNVQGPPNHYTSHLAASSRGE